METYRILNDYYSVYDEDNRLLSRHGQVEYLTTMHYIQKYLRPGMRILEIGAATGRYSHALAQMGYEVDAVELVKYNINIFKEKTRPDERVTIRQGNAKDLHFFADNTYDITLLLGPMYHLFTEGEKHQALSEAIRVTKPGGIVFIAYCGNDANVIDYCFINGKLKEERYQKLLDPVTFKAASDPAELFELYRREDIDALMAAYPTTRLNYVGTDMVTKYIRDVVEAMDDAFFQTFLRYHFAVCERPDMVGISHHFLDIHRKEA